MAQEKPDHHDADLILKLYDLRRETVMRQSREAIMGKFWPRSYADVQAVMKFDHPMNAAYRQVGSYWEMAYGFARHNVVNSDFLVESSGEGLFLFAKLKPYLDDIRRDYSPLAYRNAEWLVTHSEEARKRFEMISKVVQKRLDETK